MGNLPSRQDRPANSIPRLATTLLPPPRNPEIHSPGSQLFTAALTTEPTELTPSLPTSPHNGSYTVDVKWNGKNTLKIQDNIVTWKNVNVSFAPGQAVWTRDEQNNTDILTVRIYVPWQTSDWSQGKVGLHEALVLTFDYARHVSSGNFKRTSEGPLPCTCEFDGVIGPRPPRPPRRAPSNERANDQTGTLFHGWGRRFGKRWLIWIVLRIYANKTLIILNPPI